MDYNILRENDIRGNYPTQVNKDVAYLLGQSFAVYLNKIKIKTCMVGHDNRLSSEELNDGLINGLISSGIDVIDTGLVTTPMFNFSCMKNKIEYGIMITASHNVFSDNGFKIFGKDYLHLDQDELKKLYKIIKNEEKVMGSGKVTKTTIKDDYVKMIVSKFSKMNKKVVVDCGNGTASIVIKDIMSKLFKNITYLNSTSDGSFPVHNPDPNVEENLRWLKDVVKLKRADIGIAYDGDADRVGIVDENGKMISTDYLIGIFARDIIPQSKNKNVIIDVKCSMALTKDISKFGNPIMVKNGSAYLEKVIHDTPALIGGEYSGHIFFRDKYYGYDDGIYAGLRATELVGNKCSNLMYGFDIYENTPEIRVSVSDDIKFDVVDKIINYCKEKKYNCNFADGVRVDYDDGFSLVRCSNTGPTITMRFEASTKVLLAIRKKEFMDLVEKFSK